MNPHTPVFWIIGAKNGTDPWDVLEVFTERPLLADYIPKYQGQYIGMELQEWQGPESVVRAAWKRPENKQ